MKLSIFIIGFFIILTCFFLITIILIQNPKQGFISQSFMEDNFRFFGVKRTNILLKRITWLSSIMILFLILLFNLILKH
ncbi:preprotein translocase subunit SecG [Blattabacterium cuenoti]|uniref:preprotein translocase subunit SecG n=1 Tax=Blattabacterium cuenoti TaxID=1653831 RepID=UPI00163CAFBD|nr:preprotein translocase subunit SecG [Blattabacterium cuenoti]